MNQKIFSINIVKVYNWNISSSTFLIKIVNSETEEKMMDESISGIITNGILKFSFYFQVEIDTAIKILLSQTDGKPIGECLINFSSSMAQKKSSYLLLQNSKNKIMQITFPGQGNEQVEENKLCREVNRLVEINRSKKLEFKNKKLTNQQFIESRKRFLSEYQIRSKESSKSSTRIKITAKKGFDKNSNPKSPFVHQNQKLKHTPSHKQLNFEETRISPYFHLETSDLQTITAQKKKQGKKFLSPFNRVEIPVKYY